MLWFVPEYLGSGDFLRAADRARQPNPDSPAFADYPFLEVFQRSAPILSPPVLLGAAIALVRPHPRAGVATAAAGSPLAATVPDDRRGAR